MPVTPTIRQALVEFVADTNTRVSARTARQYQGVVELFESCMDGYGSLDDRDDRRAFCDAAGPDRIPELVDEFLGWFLVRKVVASPSYLKSCGTVVKKLGGWLLERGYIDGDDALEMGVSGGKAVRDLPKADSLRDALEEISTVHSSGETEEGHFAIERIEKGKLVVSTMTGSELRVALPPWVIEMCVPGWTFSGVLGKRRTLWELVEVWNVYP
jgi:hypothetical protein